MAPNDRSESPPVLIREAESVLRKLGFSRAAPDRRRRRVEPTFWVAETRTPTRVQPVFVTPAKGAPTDAGLEAWITHVRSLRPSLPEGILVVPSDRLAETAIARLTETGEAPHPGAPPILVVPDEPKGTGAPHWYLRTVARREVLRVATGVVVGLFRRSMASEESTPVDFEEMLDHLRRRFAIDVPRSLGVSNDEESLFLLYQMALRDSWAPNDGGANLHLLVLKATGPAARLPWFAA
ncbi:MAG: hypothetical protein ACYCPN_05315 [Thermoplasmata archaeon]